MAAHSVHIEAVELILSAIYPGGHQLLSSFTYGKPGEPRWKRRLGTEIFCETEDYLKAVLFIRQAGAPHLRSIAINELRPMITSFITENYWYVRGVGLSGNRVASYANQATIQEKYSLATALADSRLFQSVTDLTLYPLVTLNVEHEFQSEHFFFCSSQRLTNASFTGATIFRHLDPTQFPPLKQWEQVKWPVTSWLGVRSPSQLMAKKMASRVLGAIALALDPYDRYSFSERKMQGGTCTISDDESWSISPSSDPHTPGLMRNVCLSKHDGSWLESLAELFSSSDYESIAKTRALEYFYRAWFLPPRERFSILCMSLEALVGNSKKQHTTAVIKFVKRSVAVDVDDARLRLLMRIRGAIVHGAAPNVSESAHYAAYYVAYNSDPIFDLELIVAKCLRTNIFGPTHTYHPYSDQAAMDQLIAKGRLSPQLGRKDIIPRQI